MRAAIDRSLVLGLMAIICWASTMGLLRVSSETFGEFGSGFISYSIAAFLIASLYWKDGNLLLLRARYWLIAPLYLSYLIALALAIGWAQSAEQAAHVTLINYLWPTLVVLLSVRQRLRWSILIGAFLALTGVIYAADFNEGITRSVNLRVILLAALAAIAWSLYSVLLKRFPPATALTNAVVLGSASVVMGLIWASNPVVIEASFERGLNASLLLGSLTAAGYVLWDKAMVSANIAVLGLMGNFTPILAVFILAAVTGSSISMSTWYGCLLVVAGSVIAWRGLRKSESD